MTTSIESVESKALSVPEQASSLVILNNEAYMLGESLLATCKQLENEVHEAYDSVVEKAHTAHKEAVAKRKQYLDPIEQARKILKQKMIVFQDEQERIRREEQARSEAEARKRAEDEQLALAAELEKEGDTQAAEEVLAAPVQAAPVVAPKTVPAPSRLSAGRSIWNAEIVSFLALVKAVADGKQPVTLLEPNMQALNGLARSLKSGMNVPGVRATERKV